ncbi:hypothetical protein [Priestia aryabhattai]
MIGIWFLIGSILFFYVSLKNRGLVIYSRERATAHSSNG